MTTPARITARVIHAHSPAPGIRILRVAADVVFLPGQYMHILLPGEETRAFSIASAPGESFLEFHIRSAGHGVSAAAFALEPGAEIWLEGPFGDNVLRGGTRPLLALAGGIGIAPMKSIVLARLAENSALPLHLYWGARAAEELYLDGLFRELADRHPEFHYVSVAEKGSAMRQGYIGPALASDIGGLAAFDVYMAGPRPMTDALLPVLLEKGAARDRIFSDAFGI